MARLFCVCLALGQITLSHSLSSYSVEKGYLNQKTKKSLRPYCLSEAVTTLPSPKGIQLSRAVRHKTKGTSLGSIDFCCLPMAYAHWGSWIFPFLLFLHYTGIFYNNFITKLQVPISLEGVQCTKWISARIGEITLTETSLQYVDPKGTSVFILPLFLSFRCLSVQSGWEHLLGELVNISI